ncbi:MAG TPA: O-antigen ligase family protein [Blastocatellia bacterium]|nr:O-antigen ligase family protein [Blastocatellia bacterium]
MLVAVPLSFSTAIQRVFTLPKFAVLLIGSSALVFLMGLMALDPAQRDELRALRSKHVLIVSLYLVAVAISTVFGVAPISSLFGSFENQMGLITRFCFLICFLSLVVGIGNSQTRFRQTMWAMSLTGLAVATYAFIQFFGKDPFLLPSAYTFDSVAGPIVRVIGTIGHADYLGNFLVYITPISVALALATEGRVRMLALITTAVSISAIVFSGTRGAALGLIVGAIVFFVLQFRLVRASLNRRTLRRAAVALAIILVAIVVISFNPASRNITARAISAIQEGGTGAGRTVLWRDAVKMIPSFALTGCGPEGFRKAFLAYKSKEIAQLAPGTNEESSHSSYLDAAILYGLPGAILYVAIIVSSFSLLMRARRRANDQRKKSLITGLLTSLAAVATHNFFIFDQIPTGLYFFVLVALAQSALSVATSASQKSEISAAKHSALSLRWSGRAMIAVGIVVVIAAVWYAAALMKADFEIRKSFASANVGDYEGTVKRGERAAQSLEMTGAYKFQYALALTRYADFAGSVEAGKMTAARMSAINTAITQTRKSLDHTITPDSSCLLLAYLALTSGNAPDLRAWATEALKWDPYYPGAHWLMAEAYLAEGSRKEAEREATTALDINPNSQEARSALRRARGLKDTAQQTVEELLTRGQKDAEQGRMKKARKKITHAIRKARGQCAHCHRALASIYEATQQYDKAIAEWRIFLEQSTDRAAREEAQSRIESLKQKAATNQ